jgi:hypothetical protein
MDLKLVDFHPLQDESSSDTDLAATKSKRKRRRRKRGGKKACDLMNASDILSRVAATQTVESSPSSFMSTGDTSGGRKMSALELDEIVDDEDATRLFASTTGTPGSLDSSRSLWELGTIEADEDDLLSTPRPIISSIRMQSLETDPPIDVESLNLSIDSLLKSIPSFSGKDISRMCVGSLSECSRRPDASSNRLCIGGGAPKIDVGAIGCLLASISSSISKTLDQLSSKLIETGFAKPETVGHLLNSLDTTNNEDGIIPSSSIPVVNRRQRRVIEQSAKNVYNKR